MKLLTVTGGPTWPGNLPLPAADAEVGRVTFTPVGRVVNGTGGTIGEYTAKLVVASDGTLVLRNMEGGAFKFWGGLPLGVDAGDVENVRAPRYKVREEIEVEGRDISQEFIAEPYETATDSGLWNYNTLPLMPERVGDLPLTLKQFQEALGAVESATMDLFDLRAQVEEGLVEVNTEMQQSLADIAQSQAAVLAAVGLTNWAGTLANLPVGVAAYRLTRDPVYGGQVYERQTNGGTPVRNINLETITPGKVAATRVASVAALRTHLNDGAPVQTMGYSGSFSVGGGVYDPDPSDTTSADNGGDVIVGSDGTRYKLRLNGQVDVAQFGAKGDGTDESAVLGLALDAALTRKLPLSFTPNATYKQDGTIVRTVEGAADLVIYGNGATLDIQGMVTLKPALDFRGTTTQNVTTLTANIPLQSMTLTVADASSLNAGDLILIRSTSEVFDQDRPTEYTKSEFAYIASKAGNVLTLTAPTFDSYLSSADVRIDLVKPIRNITINGLKVKGNTAKDHIGIAFRTFQNVIVNACTVLNCNYYGVFASSGLGITSSSNTISGSLNTGVGYGIVYYGVQDGIMLGNRLDRCRHALEVTGGGGGGLAISRNVVMSANTATLCISSALSTHGGTELVTIIGNAVSNSGGGIHTRSGRTNVVNNTISGFLSTPQAYNWGIGVGDKTASYGDGHGGVGYSCVGNTITGAFNNGMYSTTPFVNAKILNNRFGGHRSNGMLLEGRRHTDLTVSGNTVDGSGFVAVFDGSGNQTNAFTHGMLIRALEDGTGSLPAYDGLFVEQNTLLNIPHTGIRLELGKAVGTAAVGVKVSDNYIRAGVRGIELTLYSTGTALLNNIIPALPLTLTGGLQALVFSTTNHTLTRSEGNYTSEGWQAASAASTTPPSVTVLQSSTTQFSTSNFSLKHTGNSADQQRFDWQLEKNTTGGDGVLRLRQYLSGSTRDYIMVYPANDILYFPRRTQTQGQLDIYGTLVAKPSSGQTISGASSTILANAASVQISPGSINYTLTSVPTIAAGQDGQEVTILNFGTGTITLQDNATLAGSLLKLSAATLALGPGQVVQLKYYAVLGLWKQISTVL